MSATPSPSRTAVTNPRVDRELPSWAPELAFAAVLALGAAIVLYETRGLSFYGDEWEFLLNRRGLSADVLLRPHGPHLVLVPVLVYKLWLALFGAGSYLPYRLLAAFDIAFVGFAVGLACRARWGRWWGLAPVLLFVTIGPGAITLLWPFQIGYALAVGAGIIGLLALDRRWPHAEAICCTALVISLASGSQGIGFLIGAAVMLVIRGDWRRTAWVVVIPAVLYAVWYAKYGHQYSETHLSLWKASLAYSADALSATSAGLVGLSSVNPTTGQLDLTFGVPLAVAAVAAVLAGCWRGWRPRPLFWGIAATLVFCWVAASVANWGANSRPPNDPRYLSSDIALLVIAICAALPRPRLAAGGALVACVVLAIVAATNAGQFTQTRNRLLTSDAASRAQLGALAILRPVVGRDYVLSDAITDPAALVGIRAGAFDSADRDFGLIYDSPAQLGQADESDRASADAVLAHAELSLRPLSRVAPHRGAAPRALTGSSGSAGGCRQVGATPLTIVAVPGSYEVIAPRSGPAATVTGSRFAPDAPIPLGTVAAHHVASVHVPRDGALGLPWRITVSGAGARACST